MLIRPYEGRDRAAVERIHKAQGFDYVLPDLSEPIFITKLALENDRGDMIAAAALRLTAEAYLLLDPREGTPRDRLFAVSLIHEAVRQDAYAKGLEDVHAFVPPRVARSFGRRLAALGWQRDPWTAFCRKTVGATWPVA
jgi:hypothetical protein